MKEIYIFCDGGFGNRFNALISGLALASRLNLRPIIYWPLNNWCRAPFEKIFDSEYNVRINSLSELKGTVGQFLPMLHDESAATILGISFKSAYEYSSIAHVRQAINDYEGLIYYPALMPKYVADEDIAAALIEIKFRSEIEHVVSQFIAEELGGPFYGIHLRRTDLKIGYSNDEVAAIVKSHSNALFFVCSDDPESERICAAYHNVKIRQKNSYVEKRTSDGDWNTPTLDDNDRTYHSNVERGAQSVIDAVIDMLLLAHSTILGFSGSTFQSAARIIGDNCPIVSISRPSEIKFLSLGDEIRKLKLGRATVIDIIDTGNKLSADGRAKDAVAFFKASLDHTASQNLAPIYFNIAVALMEVSGATLEAQIFSDKSVEASPDFIDGYLLSAKIALARRKKSQAISRLAKAIQICEDTNEVERAGEINHFIKGIVT
jgi:hypothetical protein